MFTKKFKRQELMELTFYLQYLLTCLPPGTDKETVYSLTVKLYKRLLDHRTLEYRVSFKYTEAYAFHTSHTKCDLNCLVAQQLYELIDSKLLHPVPDSAPPQQERKPFIGILPERFPGFDIP